MNELEFAKQLAKKAGKIIINNFGKENNIKYKDEVSKEILTNTDLAVEKFYIETIQKSKFNYPIFEEEGRRDSLKSDYIWVIDPLDGTTNFAQGIPRFCTSIALVHKGKSIMGIVYDPCRKELFYAEKNKGAYLNGKKLFVSEASKLEEAVVCVDNSHIRGARDAALYSTILPNIRAIRQQGAAALDICYVAAARFDAYACTTADKLTAWDFAAAGLILEEAGGRFTDFSGEQWYLEMRDRLATNSKLHPQILKLIKKNSLLRKD